MAEPVVARKIYLRAYAALLGLTLATTLLAFLDMGRFNTIVALVIAVIQASLIAGVFMQALYESALVRVILGGGVLWFLILITLTMTDYLTRSR
ncbi:MAG TPA: cytochrome C oxidase subunit IV family protein [Bryobacteraceae bacterium]|nr:cytochrome C oxidase subunit IV family protein [Bryobacteraceae bacterium]